MSTTTPSDLVSMLIALPRRNRGWREEYLNLLSIDPKISDLIPRASSLISLASKLEDGRNEIKSTQVHSISIREISSWGLGVLVQKELRGFGDEVCGRLLCPADQDWADPTCVDDPLHFFWFPLS